MSQLSFPKLTAEEAAAFIQNGQNVGFSGFTPAGTPKAIPMAIAKRAEAEHAAGRPFKIGIFTGASTGPSLDGALMKADAISFRAPYQTNNDLRKGINAGKVSFVDMHLSLMPQVVRYGFLGKVNVAVIEASDLTNDGEVVLTAGVGATPTYAMLADKVIIELNSKHPKALRGFHDIYQPLDPPHRREIPIYKPSDRIGTAFVKIDPKKIVGYVETNLDDEARSFDAPDDLTNKIGENVAEFLAGEIKAGRIPKEFLPIQSGVGNIANAVLGALGKNTDIPKFEMYTEVIQNSVIGLLRDGKIKFASGSSLTITPETLQGIYNDIEFFRSRIVLRPQEISNSPEIARRIGIISINTAIEVDLFGNVNSTHVMGKQLMNGIGGSGDFTRNAYISIFTCPSTAKDGKISTLVPFVSHQDHNEHSVQVVITENGVADLRGKSPRERANLLVDICAHESYRDELRAYFSNVKDGQTPQTLSKAFAMHEQFLKTGSMHGVKWD
jgi:succinate CoA transferase